MVNSIMNLINTSISSVSQWFLSVFNNSGMAEIYLAILFIYLAMKFLLKPVIGFSRGSDRARKSGADDE